MFDFTKKELIIFFFHLYIYIYIFLLINSLIYQKTLKFLYNEREKHTHKMIIFLKFRAIFLILVFLIFL